MVGVAERNENCNVCVCILFPWSPNSPNMEGLLTEMRIAMYMCILFPWPPISPNMEGLLAERNENCNVCVCILFPWSNISRTWLWVAHRNENCNVCMCILLPLITYFPKHGGGCWEKWELQCLYVYIITLITYFPNIEVGWGTHWNENCDCLYMYFIPLIIYFSIMEGDAERNEYCNVCMCILYPWSHISHARRGLLTEMRIAMSVCVYYSLDHLFPQTCRGLLT